MLLHFLVVKCFKRQDRICKSHIFKFLFLSYTECLIFQEHCRLEWVESLWVKLIKPYLVNCNMSMLLLLRIAAVNSFKLTYAWGFLSEYSDKLLTVIFTIQCTGDIRYRITPLLCLNSASHHPTKGNVKCSFVFIRVYYSWQVLCLDGRVWMWCTHNLKDAPASLSNLSCVFYKFHVTIKH